MCLAEASCRIQQAETVLSMWLESTRDNYEANLIASIITILNGVNEAIEEADKHNLSQKNKLEIIPIEIQPNRCGQTQPEERKMNIPVVTKNSSNNDHSVNGPIFINKAIRTAECADKYAHELRTEFNELLMEAIRKTDVKVAGRFTSLLNELCFMTSMTKKNISKGDSDDISER